MPLYEYHCKNCGEVFEKMMRWSEADRIPACPNCQSPDTQKRVSHVAAFGASTFNSGSSSSGCGSTGGQFS